MLEWDYSIISDGAAVPICIYFDVVKLALLASARAFPGDALLTSLCSCMDPAPLPATKYLN